VRFNEPKATQAAARLLRNRGGRMSYMKLMKLLYLADREALARWGRPITADSYVSMDKGPVLSHVLNLITEGPSPVAGNTCWTRHISEPEHYEIALKADPCSDLLSEAEDELLDDIFGRYGRLNRWALADLAPTLPEWKEPHGSTLPIEYADILQAQNKSPEDIRAIEDELDALDRIEALCGGNRWNLQSRPFK
jgi:uncharacterized phage-associated protein